MANVDEPSVAAPRILLAWSAPSHHHYERSRQWYITGGIIVIAVAGFGILTGAWTLTLVSLLLGGVYYLVRNEKAPVREIQLQSEGVEFEGNFTPWKQCKDFWIVQTPLFAELHITRNSRFNGEISIQTGDIDPLTIRSLLSQKVTMRVDQRERMVDALIRLCKL